jgi:hypothetical protein
MRFFALGDLGFAFDARLGFLRRARHQGRQFCNAVYVAVRDENWGTLDFQNQTLDVVETTGKIELTWKAESVKNGEVWATWTVKISAEAGTLRYHAVGVATQTFQTCRTGVCLLHPVAETRGLPVEVRHPDGDRTSATFPVEVSPHQPFSNVSELHHAIGPESVLAIRFGGVVFEAEDQRNWTDYSYKTYCNPLGSGRASTIPAGHRIEHSVEFAVSSGKPNSWMPTPAPFAPRRQPMRVGLLATQTTAEERVSLAQIPWDHIGVVLHSGFDDAELTNARLLAEKLNASLRVFWDGGFAQEDAERLAVAAPREIALRDFTVEVDPEWRKVLGKTAFLTMSPDNFTELNRTRPHLRAVPYDGVGFAANPQVHAFDEVSILETPTTFADIVSTIEKQTSLPIYIGPVTFEPRGVEPEPLTDERRRVHARYIEDTVKVIRRTNVASLTLGPATGPRGFLQPTGDLLHDPQEFTDWLR